MKLNRMIVVLYFLKPFCETGTKQKRDSDRDFRPRHRPRLIRRGPLRIGVTRETLLVWDSRQRRP